MKDRRILLLLVALALFPILMCNVRTVNSSGNPASVRVGVWLVNVEKIDLAASSYRLDFYLWFRFNSSEIGLEDVKEFEFVNGYPTKYKIYSSEDQGYLEYRVRGIS